MRSLVVALLLLALLPAGASAATHRETVAVGKKLTLRLESNPTTGYSWSVASIDPRYLQLVSHRYVDGGGEEIGGGGTDVFTFVGRKPIRMTALRMVYRQSFDPRNDPTVELYNVRVVR